MATPGAFNVSLKRRRIEDRIVALANAVDVRQREGAWLDGERVSDFIYAWHDLLVYYEDSRDTTIGRVVLDIYRAMLGFLNAASDNARLPLRRRERAQSAISELHTQLESVLAQLDRNTLSSES